MLKKQYFVQQWPFCCIPVVSAASQQSKVQVWGPQGSRQSTRSRSQETRGSSEDRGSRIWGNCYGESSALIQITSLHLYQHIYRSKGQYSVRNNKNHRVRLTRFVQGRSPLNPFLGGPPQRKVPENLHSNTAKGEQLIGRVIHWRASWNSLKPLQRKFLCFISVPWRWESGSIESF